MCVPWGQLQVTVARKLRSLFRLASSGGAATATYDAHVDVGDRTWRNWSDRSRHGNSECVC